jgi:sirohydrochlorin ferrochelatase
MWRTLAALMLLATPSLAQTRADDGVLLLAHGGGDEWNGRVEALARSLDRTQPVEVALGMASRPSIQRAVDALVARGVRSIVAVPLFISSHSSVVTSTAYQLGLRPDMPPDLAIFATMRHGGAHGFGVEGHETARAEDNTRPVTSPVPIRMSEALNRHPLVGAILGDRAREISTAPSREAVILVAHGPVPDEDNRKWLDDMHVLARQVDDVTEFGAVEYLTVRDDAPKPVRDATAAELRVLVEKHASQGRRVLVVPLLVSYGGIEQGIRQRLDGLTYVVAERGLMPDDRLIQWVRQSAAR